MWGRMTMSDSRAKEKEEIILSSGTIDILTRVAGADLLRLRLNIQYLGSLSFVWTGQCRAMSGVMQCRKSLCAEEKVLFVEQTRTRMEFVLDSMLWSYNNHGGSPNGLAAILICFLIIMLAHSTKHISWIYGTDHNERGGRHSTLKLQA